MNLLAKSTLTAVAAAMAAAAVLTTVAIPAQAAGYKRAPTTPNPRWTHRHRDGHGERRNSNALMCLKTSGDVMAQPLVTNTTGQTLPIGKVILWVAYYAKGAPITGNFTLTKPLYSGQSLRVPKQLPWNFTCQAYAV